MNRISLILSCLLLVCNMAWCQVSNQLQKNDAAVFQVKHTTDEGKAILWKVRLKVLSAEADKMKVEFSTYDYETPITGNAQLQNLTQEQIDAILEQVMMMSHAVINYQDGKPVGVENMAEIRAAVPNLMNEVLSAEAKKKGESQKIVEQMKPLTDMLVGMIQKTITEKSVITLYQDFLQTFYLKDTGKEIVENESGVKNITIVEPTAANGEYSFRQLANTKLDKAKLKALTEKKASAGQEGNIEQLSDAIGEALSAIIDSVDAVTLIVQKWGMLAKNGIVNRLTILSTTEISAMGETVTGVEQTEIIRTDSLLAVEREIQYRKRMEQQAIANSNEAQIPNAESVLAATHHIENLLRMERAIAKNRNSSDNNASGGVQVFDVVEQMPEFPGGAAGLMKFLSNNIVYPPIAKENGIQGRVVCTFVVERDGSITDIKVSRTLDPSLDREAVRVLSKMPKWIPGKQKGKPVRVKFTVPVTFQLR